MNEEDKIRNQVSDFYAKSVNAGTGCGCGCSTSCCSTPTLPKGVAAGQAGYTEADFAGLPEDAVASSFGCGNPLAFAGVKAGQTVVDLGSGAGIDLLIASKIVGPTGRVIGVDMTDDMIEHARTNLAMAGAVNAEVRKGIIEDLPVESSSVDWVISNCVINLSPEKDRVFAEITRVLKPGGQISISDIVTHDLPGWVKKNVALYASCIAGAVTEDEYLDGLRRAGMTDVQVTERMIYTAEQMRALVGSEIPETFEGIEDLSAAVEGRIWSAKVTGRKAG